MCQSTRILLTLSGLVIMMGCDGSCAGASTGAQTGRMDESASERPSVSSAPATPAAPSGKAALNQGKARPHLDGGGRHLESSPTTPACPAAPNDWAKRERELVAAVNTARRQARDCGSQHVERATQLTLDRALSCAARVHAHNMAERGFFSHIGTEGDTPAQRAKRQGYAGEVVENVSWGQSEADGVVAAWLKSPAHCAALMNSRARRTGVGYARGANDKTFWVQVYGAK